MQGNRATASGPPVFISYCSEDTKIADQVCSLLEKNGIGCWIAPRNVEPGSIYSEQIIKAIKNAKALVLIYSSRTCDSTHVRNEVERAFAYSITIIPFRVENCAIGEALEYFLGSSQWLDAWEPPLEGKAQLLADLLSRKAGLDKKRLMKCPDCGHEDLDGAKYCAKCGSKLSRACPECGSRLEAAAKFCGHCGLKLQDDLPSLEQQFDKVRDTLSPTLGDKLSIAADGENRLVTVLFADMFGSMKTTRELDPEDAAMLAGRLLAAVLRVLSCHECRIDRIVGDKVMAVFGVPHAHEDDAHRAVKAARQIINAVNDLDLHVGIGINTGQAYFGPIGDGEIRQTTVIGSVVNLAVRLQGEAEADQIIVSEATHRQVRRLFRFEPLSITEEKRGEAAKAYRFVSVLQRQDNRRGLDAMQAEMIGREEELGRLHSALKKALSGSGQMVSIVGEAGVGKSRLAAEFRDLAKTISNDKPILFLTGRCVEHGSSAGYVPFSDLLRGFFSFASDDSDEDRAAKIVQALEELKHRGHLTADQIREIAPLLGNLMSVTGSEEWQQKLQFVKEEIKQKTFSAVQGFLVALSQEYPLVMSLGDLQWSDDLSLELISSLMEILSERRILMLCACRPEGKHTQRHLWRIAEQKCRGRYTEIHLYDLTREQGQQMVESMLGSEDIPPSAIDMILERSQGNPLFVEEIIRSYIDQGAIFRGEGGWQAKPDILRVEVPETIQSLMLSRIDQLGEGARLVLQEASVIGKLFSQKLLRSVSELETSLDDHLWQLEDRNFIYAVHSVPEIEYSFKHILTRETVYNTVISSRRKQLHAKVAKAYESLNAERMEEIYEILAHHYSRSNNVDKAIEYLEKAGQKAAKRYAHSDALESFRNALELSGEGRHVDRILALRGQLFLDIYQGREAARDFNRMLERAKAGGNRHQELDALLGLGAAYYAIALDAQDSDDASRSREYYAAAYSLARELDDKRNMVRALIPTRWFSDFWPEYHDQAIANLEEASALSEEIGDEELIIESKVSMLPYRKPAEAIEQAESLRSRLEAARDLTRLKDMYFCIWGKYNSCGYFEKAAEVCTAAIKLAREAGVPPVQFPTWRVFPLLNLGRYDAAWESIQEEVADEEHKLGRAVKEMGKAAYCMELMEYGKAAGLFRSVAEQGRRLGRAWLQSWAKAELMRALLSAGKAGQKEWNEIRRDFEQRGASVPPVLEAEIALSESRLDEALERTTGLCRQAKEDGCRRDYIVALEVQLRVLLKCGKPEEVIAVALGAISEAEEMGYLPMLWRLRAAKAQALSRIGNAKDAVEEHAKAAATIRRLADTIRDPKLKRGFLANPQTASILEASNGSG